MSCVECGRRREPNEPGWLVVLTPPDDPAILFCPECFAALIGGPPAEPRPAEPSTTTKS